MAVAKEACTAQLNKFGLTPMVYHRGKLRNLASNLNS
jgi:hypothetical protein